MFITKFVLIMLMGAFSSIALASVNPVFMAKTLYEKGFISNGKPYEVYIKLTDDDDYKMQAIVFVVDGIKMNVPMDKLEKSTWVRLRDLYLSHSAGSARLSTVPDKPDLTQITYNAEPIVTLGIAYGPYVDYCDDGSEPIGDFTVHLLHFKPDGSLEGYEHLDPLDSCIP